MYRTNGVLEMSGVDGVITKIIEDAKNQADEKLNSANQQATDILDDARQKAEEIKKNAAENAKVNAVRLEERLISMAQLEVRKKRLRAKQEIIDEAFDESVKSLLMMNDNEYIKLLTKMVTSSVSTGREQVVLTEEDRKRLGAKLVKAINDVLKEKGLADEISLADKTHKSQGGVILVRGRVEINYTFDAVIFMQRNSMEEKVVEILFTCK